LPCRRIRRKPLNPLFIHAGEVCFFEQDDGETYGPFERSTRRFEDGGHILQALPRLLLNCVANNLRRHGIVRPRAGNKD
jgi:hypothetical protein